MRQRHRQVHRLAWLVLALLLPGILLGALAIRRSGPTETAAIQLAPPPQLAQSPQPPQTGPSSQPAPPAQSAPSSQPAPPK